MLTALRMFPTGTALPDFSIDVISVLDNLHRYAACRINKHRFRKDTPFRYSIQIEASSLCLAVTAGAIMSQAWQMVI